MIGGAVISGAVISCAAPDPEVRRGAIFFLGGDPDGRECFRGGDAGGVIGRLGAGRVSLEIAGGSWLNRLASDPLATRRRLSSGELPSSRDCLRRFAAGSHTRVDASLASPIPDE